MKAFISTVKNVNLLKQKYAATLQSHVEIPPLQMKLLIAFSHLGSVTLRIVSPCRPVRY